MFICLRLLKAFTCIAVHKKPIHWNNEIIQILALLQRAILSQSGLKSQTTSSNFASTKQFRLRIESNTSMALGPVGCYQNNYLLSSKFLPLSLFCFKGLGIRQARVLIADAYLHFREPPLPFLFCYLLRFKVKLWYNGQRLKEYGF